MHVADKPTFLGIDGFIQLNELIICCKNQKIWTKK